MKTLSNDTVSGMGICREGGLTKREYFAALAMQGLLANNTMLNANGVIIVKTQMAELAVISAEALIERLNK